MEKALISCNPEEIVINTLVFEDFYEDNIFRITGVYFDFNHESVGIISSITVVSTLDGFQMTVPKEAFAFWRLASAYSNRRNNHKLTKIFQ